MSLNWKEIDRILREIPTLIGTEPEGSRIQQVQAPDYRSLVFEMYHPAAGEYRLFFSFASPFCRLHLLTRDLPRVAVPPRLVPFLRAHVRGGRLRELRQLGRERIVLMRVGRGEEEKLLWARLWAGAANLIVTDAEYRILDALYRRPRRGEVSGGTFNPLEALREKLASYPEEDRFEVRDLPAVPGGGGFNRQVEDYYFGLEQEERGRRRQDSRLQELRGRENALLVSLEGLRRRLAEYTRYDELKAAGDLILGNLHRIGKGDRWLEAEDYGDPGRSRRIELSPELTPAQNAERYYERYRKARGGLLLLQERIAEQEEALRQVQAEMLRAEAAEGEAPGGPETASAAEAASTAGPSGGTKGGPPAKAGASGRGRKESPPGLSYRSGGFQILVGRTAAENDQLLRRFVRGNDYWFHARDVPGAYVFVRTPSGKSIPLETMLDAGTLAVFYSKARSSGQGEVYYTRVKYLRRVREGRLGRVIPTQEKNLSIRLDPLRLRRLVEEPDPGGSAGGSS